MEIVTLVGLGFITSFTCIRSRLFSVSTTTVFTDQQAGLVAHRSVLYRLMGFTVLNQRRPWPFIETVWPLLRVFALEGWMGGFFSML